MKIKKISISVILLIFGSASISVYSQQLPLYSQYVQNAFLLNPGIAGHDGFTTCNLTARRQWIGYKDGPQTYSASAQTRLMKRRKSASGGKVTSGRSGNVGVGANFFGDINGAISKMGIGATYAYHIHFQNSQLSFGLTAKLTQIGIDKSKLNFEDNSAEPLWNELGRNIYTPDAQVGVFWSNYRGFIGFSVDQLFQSAARLTQNDVNYIMKRQYYILGGYTFPVGDNYDIEPSFLIKSNEKILKGSFTTTQADIGARFFISKMYWAGLYYRTAYKGTYIFTLGLRYNQFVFGYAFDYSSSGISNATYGSHEFIMAMKFGDSARRYKWLDRY
jgi:type IX secretion system PorP/SprF family membrane protein